MSRTETWKAWLGILAILIFSGLMAAFWPTISENLFSALGSMGGGGGMSVPAETVTLPVPGVEGGVTLTSVQILLGLGFIVVGVVVVTGIIMGIVNVIVSRWITNVETSETYQEGTAALEQRESAELTAKREAQPADTSQQNDYSRWSVIATSMAILFFAVVLGYLFGYTLFPSGQIANEEQIINITAIITGAFFLITLLYLLLRMDKERLNEINARANAGIPWDAFVVISLGALVLGLGIGLVIFLNLPA